MFGKGLGGIEQAFLDYGVMLAGKVPLTCLTHTQALIVPALKAKGLAYELFNTRNNWDVLSMLRIRRRLRRGNAKAVICHGVRAFNILSKAAWKICPVIAVAHNYSLEKIAKADAVICITHDLKQQMQALGVAEERLYRIPNGIDCSVWAGRTPRQYSGVCRIGTLGRFVPKKGFDVFIRALAVLKASGFDFTAVIGGDGEERDKLIALRNELGLKDILELPGWVSDRQEFFNSLDIFCLPSLHEPFGIVVLEAMAVGLPIVSTASEGPLEILKHGVDALLAPLGDERALAVSLARILENPDLRIMLATNAEAKVLAEYDLKVISGLIMNAVEETCERYNSV